MGNNWKRKLAAYLHDPPSKCLDIYTHGERSDAAFRQAGFVDTEIGEYFAHADHTAAAADRLPFPQSRSAGLSCAFDGIRNAFRHPLSGQLLPFHKEFASVEQGFEGESSVQPKIADECLDALSNDNLRWRARFFAHWRLWPKHAAEKDYRLSLLPADTRIPDHTIWSHMQVVSALDGCVKGDKVWQPAFLKFQLGPVQDFIAAARSIRDLWSGSYLLSWLMAAGMKALSEEVGPDAVIFPNLRGQPLFDLQWNKDLWSKVSINGKDAVWDSLNWQNRDLLTPNLPNVFLAVVPADRAGKLGKRVSEAIQIEWETIAGSVWADCGEAGLTEDEDGITKADRKLRFDKQIKRFLLLSWKATPWPETLKEAQGLAHGFSEDMPITEANNRVAAVVRMATQTIPKDEQKNHRDGRYYVGGKTGPKTELNNIGLGWSVILALNGWELDAVRQTRGFDAANAGIWKIGTFQNKDSLTGREEAVAGGRTWGERSKEAGEYWPALFKKGDWLGAPTLVKRVWHRAYLEKEWKLKTDSSHFPMPNTRDIAAHQSEKDCGDETAEDSAPSEKYFAVIAFDGDHIGEWVSGKKTPKFSTQLADYKDGSGNSGFGARPYFERPEFKGGNDRAEDFLEQRRPLSPSYHIEFSEALNNFALLCARPIVEAFDGRLIYAGGDDVLAITPADTALACAKALRRAFTGCSVDGPVGKSIFKSPAPGYLTSESMTDDSREPIPFIVPGPAADASVGIAIGHFKAPLQDIVRQAQAAEKRAKHDIDKGGHGRGAVAVTLLKRSGEIQHWGCKWDNGGLDAFEILLNAMKTNVVSGKFPHRVIEYLEPLRSEAAKKPEKSKATEISGSVHTAKEFDKVTCLDVVSRYLEMAADKQRGSKYDKTEVADLVSVLKTYGESLKDPEQIIRNLIGLMTTVAFAARTLPSGTPSENKEGTQP